MSRFARSGIAVAVSLLVPLVSIPDASAQAGPTSIYAEHYKRIKAPGAVSAYGPDLFGDNVNLYTGSLEFVQQDVSIPGNFSIPVSVDRRLKTGEYRHKDAHFGRWELEIPRIHGMFAAATSSSDFAWKSYVINSPGSRCTNFGPPPMASGQASSGGSSTSSEWAAEEFWHGTFLYIPGQGDQQLLSRDIVQNSNVPTDGGDYKVVTTKFWSATCITTMQNGSGEGFLVSAPDGTKYQFDWMVTFDDQPALSKSTDESTSMLKAQADFEENRKKSKEKKEKEKDGDGPIIMAPATAILRRSEVWILPTRITDRHGNWVSYTYEPGSPRVTKIEASDGRWLAFTYTGVRNQIATVSDSYRRWTYSYQDDTLSTVTLPDNKSTWNLLGLNNLLHPFSLVNSPSCDDPGDFGGVPQSWSGSATHPSGANASFTIQAMVHARSNVPENCMYDGANYFPLTPRYFYTFSLMNKQLWGAGLSTLSWDYRYDNPIATWSNECTGTCDAPKNVTVTDPEGIDTVHTFGTKYQDTDGKLQLLDEGGLRQTRFDYQQYTGQPYPEIVGYPDPTSAGTLEGRLQPLRLKEITQQGEVFTWRVDSFDKFARPTQVYKGSTTGSNLTETTQYFDHTNKWVLGQIRTLTAGGKAMVSKTYFGSTANLETLTEYGVFKERYTYHPNGTLASREDGRLKRTTYSNAYKRGIPTLVTYHDGSTEKATVHDMGGVTSLTNQLNATTTLGYDALGNLNLIQHPVADSVAWNVTQISQFPVFTGEYGVNGTHWRQLIDTGRARTVTVFDALMRPVWTRTSDRDRDSTTSRAVKKNFDSSGRVTFESYPKRDIADINVQVDGVTSRYDALGRPILRTEDSELGDLNTQWFYESNFSVRERNPKLFDTVKTYTAFDDPNDALLVKIQAPEQVVVDFTRDLWGKTRWITRSGGGVAATRRYVYDTNERLCKTLEPEAAPVLVDYDAAGNTSWRSDSPTLTSATCDRASVLAGERTNYTYDDLNRLTNVDFPSGFDIGRTYYLDNSLKTISSGGSTWTYGYNKRGLVETESLSYGGATYLIGRNYDANGSPSAIVYPGAGSFTTNLTPNALGEPTHIASGTGVYASAISFHPNGALQGFTYGNGIQHTTNQNLRGLPSRSIDVGVIDDSFTYDKNSNVERIQDNRAGASPNKTRSMLYDGLDRLTKATSAGIWGDAIYTYDALDNLKTTSVTAGATARFTTHVYDYTKNRLSQIQSSNPTYNLSFGYDTKGNVTSRGSQVFSFDKANRMTAATGKGTYVYDGHGRRVSVVGTDNVNRYQIYGLDGKFMYAGVTTSSAPGVRYIYLNRHLIAEVNGSATIFNHTDALGSPVATTTNSSTTPSHTHYEPYGKTAGGFVPSIGFTGHVNASDIGMVYMQQRYYDPVTARSLSVDPVTTDANSGNSFNRYAYSNNSPYKYIDPDGRNPVGIAVGIVAEVGIQMGVEGKTFSELDGTDIFVAGVIGAFAPGAGSSIIRGVQAGSKVSSSLKAINTLKSKSANTSNRANKLVTKIDENAKRAKTEIGEAAVTATAAAGGVVVKKIVQDGVNQAQDSAEKEKKEPPPPAPQDQ